MNYELFYSIAVPQTWQAKIWQIWHAIHWAKVYPDI